MPGHECYHCKQWVEEGEPHDCWTTTERALTEDLSEDLREAWERLRETAVEFGEQRIYASHNSIMFSRKACYFFVRPKARFLELCVFLGREVKGPQVRKVTPSSRTKLAHILHVRHRDEVEPPLTDWLREAYEMSEQLSGPAARKKKAKRTAFLLSLILVAAALPAVAQKPAPDPEPLHVEEEVVVIATTRTGRRLEDQPTRVEVLGREEIEEKMLMTPGDIVMMLNEMGGMRVQATSPSIGAASVRVQGMKGRYTRFLSDGLPLFGQQVGGLGLLQIPPMDLGQVEVIKGVASAFYGAGAMGGVVNLLSRRPAEAPVREVLLNQTTLNGTDAVLFLASPASGPWSASLLAGGHRQSRRDRDEDGWADVAGYSRGVFRPRVFWDGGAGRSAFLTAGVTIENREGGTMEGAVLPGAGAPFVEALDTGRFDMGGTAQTILGGRYVLTARAAAAWSRHDHAFGAELERDAHDTAFGEVALRGAAGSGTWVAGAAYERDQYDPRDVPRFAYTFHVPGVFAQYDAPLAPWVAVSAGARVDVHSEHGAFFSPRVSALLQRGEWSSRVSVGRGFFPSTPLTEETEAAGLRRLSIPRPLEAEVGTSVSVDVTRELGAASLTATFFGSRIADPLVVDRDRAFVLRNLGEATTNLGVELLATARRGPWVGTGTYTYVRAREGEGAARNDVELTPRHSAGFVGMWEDEETGRVGLELYYTGRQRLEENPFRSESRPYVIVGLLVERCVAGVRLFVNGENLTNVRQTRWDPLVRSTRGVDGRWTVDAWAPLDGRVINGGVRLGW